MRILVVSPETARLVFRISEALSKGCGQKRFYDCN